MEAPQLLYLELPGEIFFYISTSLELGYRKFWFAQPIILLDIRLYRNTLGTHGGKPTTTQTTAIATTIGKSSRCTFIVTMNTLIISMLLLLLLNKKSQHFHRLC